MKFQSTKWAPVVVLTVGAALLCSCAQTKLRIEDDFGQAVTQDLAAQIADPDAGRNAGPPPPTSGQRAVLAIKNYQADNVTPPSGVGASGSSSGYGPNGGPSGGGSGAPSGAGASSAAAPAAGP